jgi:predicted transcriptional regulator of viral defense system
MSQIESLQRLRKLTTPVFETRDAAAVLRVPHTNASTILRRLARDGLIVHLSHGRWLADAKINRLALPELVSAPWPAYVSLQSALFHHGMIEQIPAVIYAVTLSRPRRVQTPLGTISFHRMPPELFKGFELTTGTDAKMAIPEKALFDTLYLGPARSRLFAQLPELTIPRRFGWTLLQQYTSLVKSESRRAFLTARNQALRTA